MEVLMVTNLMSKGNFSLRQILLKAFASSVKKIKS